MPLATLKIMEELEHEIVIEVNENEPLDEISCDDPRITNVIGDHTVMCVPDREVITYEVSPSATVTELPRRLTLPENCTTSAFLLVIEIVRRWALRELENSTRVQPYVEQHIMLALNAMEAAAIQATLADYARMREA